MTEDDFDKLLQKLNEEDVFVNLEFESDEISKLPKLAAALVIGTAIIDSESFHFCSDGHLHVYLVRVPDQFIEESPNEAAQIFH